MPRGFCGLVWVAGLALSAEAASASERSFVYTQQSTVLAPGSSELEPSTTFRAGRERYFSALDGRLELEHGLSPGLQLALYWNFSAQARDVILDPLTGTIGRVSDSEFASASLELKYQLSDPAADALGSALYLEPTLGPSEAELEAKLIVDRVVGKWLFAANLSAEYALEFVRQGESSEVEKTFALEPTLAGAYQLPRGFSLGLELRAPLGLSGEPASSALFGGPVARFGSGGFWATLGVEPQLVAFSGQSPHSRLDLATHERLEVRLLTGFLL
jgi:hypothetical protein